MKFRTIVSLLLVAAALAACGGSKPTAIPAPGTQSTPVAAQPTVRPTTAVVQPTAVPTTPPAEPTRAAEDYDLGQSSDMSKLNSYRATYSWKWSETKDGTPTTGYWEALEEYSKSDSARHTVWSGTQGAFETISLGQYTYMKGEDNQWLSLLSTQSDPFGASALISDPLGLISGNKGKLVQRGMSVNGVVADRYALDQGSSAGFLAFGVADRMTGDVYVSSQLQIVVKYVAHYEGKKLAISGGTDGVLDVAFDLTNINQPVRIVAPEGVKPPIADDIPVIEGATELTAMSGVVSYKTTQSAEEVTAFYRQAMPAKGWAAGEGGIEGVLSFTKGERQATVMIQAESGLTSVTVIAAE